MRVLPSTADGYERDWLRSWVPFVDSLRSQGDYYLQSQEHTLAKSEIVVLFLAERYDKGMRAKQATAPLGAVRHKFLKEGLSTDFLESKIYHIKSDHITSPSIPSHHILSHYISFYPIPHYHILSHPIPSHHITSNHISFCHITSYHILSHPILSHHITSNHISFCHITSHQITSHPITSNQITSHPLLSHPIPKNFGRDRDTIRNDGRTRGWTGDRDEAGDRRYNSDLDRDMEGRLGLDSNGLPSVPQEWLRLGEVRRNIKIDINPQGYKQK